MEFFLRYCDAIAALTVTIVGVLVIAFHIDSDQIRTIFVFVVITLSGFNIAHCTARSLGDANLNILGPLWLCKVLLTLLFLFAGWVPMLSPDSPSWGFDPQRFYLYSQQILEGGESGSSIGLTYFGIVYYYAAIFFLFGENPASPAIVNIFVTLLATVAIIKASYRAVPSFHKRRYLIAGLLLIPELLWFDIMTSRETVMGALLVFFYASVCKAFSGQGGIGFWRFLSLGLSLGAILAIRPSMILPIFLSMFVFSAFSIGRARAAGMYRLFFFMLICLSITLGPTLQGLIGGVRFSFSQLLASAVNINENVASDMQWSTNSIGLLLAPTSIFEAIIFTFPRTVLYLAAPLPNSLISVSDFLSGHWVEWQKLITSVTSFIIMMGFPYVLAGTAYAWRVRRQSPGPIILIVAFWSLMLSISGGNIIIHERYRVMVTLFLFSSMWLGCIQNAREAKVLWFPLWYSLGLLLIVFYLFYKFI